ncbi:MAG: Mur ligase domain-containing protein, partial [Dehalococcoidia bacterium]
MTSPRLDVAFVTAALGPRLRHPVPRELVHTAFDRAVIDSREARAGDLFVALLGERVDGHDFAARAVASGAAGILVTRAVEGVDATST